MSADKLRQVISIASVTSISMILHCNCSFRKIYGDSVQKLNFNKAVVKHGRVHGGVCAGRVSNSDE